MSPLSGTVRFGTVRYSLEWFSLPSVPSFGRWSVYQIAARYITEIRDVTWDDSECDKTDHSGGHPAVFFPAQLVTVHVNKTSSFALYEKRLEVATGNTAKASASKQWDA